MEVPEEDGQLGEAVPERHDQRDLENDWGEEEEGGGGMIYDHDDDSGGLQEDDYV